MENAGWSLADLNYGRGNPLQLAALVEHALLDHLIRPPQQQRRWDRQIDRLGGLEVHHQFEFRRLLDGKISGLGALEDQVNTYPQFAPCFPELPRFEMDCLAVSSLFGSRGSIRPGPTRDDL